MRNIVFYFSKTDHLIIDGAINKEEAVFIIDTGANYTCIDLQRAQQLGLPLILSDEPAGGLGTTNMEKSETVIDRLYIGDVLLEKIPIAAIDLSNVIQVIKQLDGKQIDGVIGNDILKRFEAIIDYGKCSITLHV
jgi:predicted aspartyl protease